MKVKKVNEFIDDDLNIIGNKDTPTISNNNITVQNSTTDKSAMNNVQNFRNDFLGRFGFYFYENDAERPPVVNDLAKLMYDKYKETLEYYYENNDKLESDYLKHIAREEGQLNDIDYKWADKVMEVIKPHMENALDGVDHENVNESIVEKEDDHDINKKKISNEMMKSVDKVSELIDKLPDHVYDELIERIKRK